LASLDAKAGLAADVRSSGGWETQPVELVQPRYPQLMIAIVESPDDRASEIISALPDVREISAAVIDALPGEEDS
jgi:hypothetical protein